MALLKKLFGYSNKDVRTVAQKRLWDIVSQDRIEAPSAMAKRTHHSTTRRFSHAAHRHNQPFARV